MSPQLLWSYGAEFVSLALLGTPFAAPFWRNMCRGANQVPRCCRNENSLKQFRRWQLLSYRWPVQRCVVRERDLGRLGAP